MPMPPSMFPIRDSFRHRSPELVRSMAKQAGFELARASAAASASEVWLKPDGRAGDGVFVVRLDARGHNSVQHFGSRPHYHKEWAPSAARALRFGQTRWYDDDGQLGDTGEHPDAAAAAKHIAR